MTTPSVVEKQPLDINLQGGVDQSQPEEAVDWTKRLVEANNILVDGDSLRVRPGIRKLFEHGNGTTSPWSTAHRGATRLADSGGSLVGVAEGCLYQAQEVPGAYDFLDRNNRSGTYCPAWEVESQHVGHSNCAGVVGVALLTKYKAIATLNYSKGIANAISGTITIIDNASGAVAARYTTQGGVDALCGMVASEDRYIYLFAHNYTGVDIPTFLVIDTDNLPVNLPAFSIAYPSSDITHSWKGLSSTATGWSAVAGTTGAWYHITYNRATATTSELNISSYFVSGAPTDIHDNIIVGYCEDEYPSEWGPTTHWRAPFAPTTWTSTSSSGSVVLSPGVSPVAGAALNGKATADFNGTTHYLDATAGVNTFSATEGSAWVLFRADTATADAGTPYANPGMLVESSGSARWGISFSTAGVVFHALLGGSYRVIKIACATGGWHLAQCRFNGTAFEARVDGGAWSPAATGAITPSAVVRMGANYTSGFLFDGKIADAGTDNTRRSDTEFNNLKSWVNSEYALAL